MKLFSSISSRRPKQNKFDLSHEKKLSLKIGNLVPIMVQEILPGDSFKVTSEIMMRFAPMISPVMHRINVYTHYFFVPNRIVWNEWEDFITGGPDGTSLPVAPYYQSIDVHAKMTQGSLSDYLGLPTVTGALENTHFSAIPFRAYQKIYNEYYRDQNLETEIVIPEGSGLQTPLSFDDMGQIRTRAWEKDYFTSALPWTQRGPEVTIPFSAEVNYKPIAIVKDDLGNPIVTDGLLGTNAVGSPTPGSLAVNKTTATSGSANLGTIENIEDITNGTATINDLRRSVRLQEWLEKNARGGARYIEQLLSHWGRAPQDARLQRPEYLGGGKQPVTISEVLATFSSVDAPQGEMAGHGISVGNTNGFKKTFDEHGYVIGIMSCIPTTAYFQGIPRHFQRPTKLDYAWPEFAQLGEQAIYNREVFFSGVNLTNPDATWGYTPRYSEYKFGISTVHGEFRGNLDFWHMGRKFADLPALNKDFVMLIPDDPELKRIFAVTDADTDDLYCQIYNDVSALRSLPYYGTPTL